MLIDKHMKNNKKLELDCELIDEIFYKYKNYVDDNYIYNMTIEQYI